MALIRLQGGEIRIPHHLLTFSEEKFEIEYYRDPSNPSEVLRIISNRNRRKEKQNE